MKMASARVVALAIMVTGLFVAVADAAEISAAVQALLKAQCVKCHGPNKPKAGLDLSSPAGLARGSENGAVVVGGKLDRSLLWR